MLKSLAKIVLIPLGLIAVASAIDAAILKNIFGSDMTTLIISNKEMNDITKIIKPLEESGLPITIKSKTKEQKKWVSRQSLLGTLGASLLGNLLTGKRVKQSNIPRQGVIQAGEVTIRAGEGTIRQLEQARIFNAALSFN